MRARKPAVRRQLLVALALLACALPAAVSLAATNPSWRGAQALGAGDSFGPEIAVDDDGDATAVWIQGSDVLASSRRPGGHWSDQPEPLDPGMAPQAGAVVAAAAPTGQVVAVWS